MRQLHHILVGLALASAAGLSTVASAAGFSGNVFVPGLNRIIATGITQGSSSANLPALPVRVTLCSGAVEMPVFVITSPTEAVANGSCYRIWMRVLGPDRTRLEVFHSGGSNGVRRVELGGGVQKVVFDRRSPNPGTSFSASGRDGTYLGGNGPWLVTMRWTNPIQVGTMPALGDVYNKVTLEFSTCFGTNNYVYLELDTDEVM